MSPWTANLFKFVFATPPFTLFDTLSHERKDHFTLIHKPKQYMIVIYIQRGLWQCRLFRTLGERIHKKSRVFRTPRPYKSKVSLSVRENFRTLNGSLSKEHFALVKPKRHRFPAAFIGPALRKPYRKTWSAAQNSETVKFGT